MSKGLVAVAVNGLYLKISEPKPNAKGRNKNRTDAPAKVVAAYQKRWRIKLLFRNAKNELGLADVIRAMKIILPCCLR